MRESILVLMKSEAFASSVKKAFEANVGRSTAVATRTAAPSGVKAVTPSLIILDRE